VLRRCRHLSAARGHSRCAGRPRRAFPAAGHRQRTGPGR
jgi:hypothetical protein